MTVNVKNTPIDLDSFVPYLTTRLADLIARRTAAIAKKYDLNLSHWRVLAAIAHKPGRTANEVVAVTPMDKGIVSRAVKHLIEIAMVTRKASNADGRVAYLYLTSKGERLYNALAEDVRSVDEEIFRTFTRSEKDQVEKLIKRMILTLAD